MKKTNYLLAYGRFNNQPGDKICNTDLVCPLEDWRETMPVVATRWLFRQARCVFSWNHQYRHISGAETPTSDWTGYLLLRYDLSPIGESGSHHTFISAGPIILTACLSPFNDERNFV